MKRAVGAPLVAVAILLIAAQAASATDPIEPDRAFVPGEAIVRFEPGVDASERRAAREDAGVEFDSSLLLARTQVVAVGGPVREAVRELEAQPGVEYAEPNYIWTNAAAPPNDARFPELWGLRNVGQTVSGIPGAPGVDIGALPAWDVTRGAGQVIAIVDGGVAMDHPDLAANLWTNPGEIAGNGKDDDGNTFVDDVHGWDFRAGDAVPEDHGTSHGTHVAGTAAAVAGNGVGVAGVAPQATFMPVAGTGPNGSGPTSALANGIAYAAREGATVINGSFSGTGFSATMENAILTAQAEDAVVVVAAGNSADNVDSGTSAYPCAYPEANLVCVAALNADGSLASYSNYGPVSVDVGAPGTGVLSSAITFDNLFTDDFSGASLSPKWVTAGTNNSWGIEAGTLSDSPGANYKSNTNSSVTMASPLSFAGRQNCRVTYSQLRDTEPNVDALSLGIVDGGDFESSLGFYTGANGGFLGVDLPLTRYADTSTTLIYGFDGSPSVRFRFTLTSDGSIEGDGVRIDNFALACRSLTFGPASYASFNGTSMASPHVAGAVALLRAADPSLTADEAADRIIATAVPMDSLEGITAVGGRVDAAAAIGGGSPPVVDPGPPVDPGSPPASPPASTPAGSATTTGTPTTPGDPCVGLSAKKLADCKLKQRIAKACGGLKKAKQATCSKRITATARCKAMPTKGRKAKAKRAKCLAKAKLIGKPKPRKRKR